MYRLFFNEETSDANFEDCLKTLEEFTMKIHSVSIQEKTSKLPKHISFQSDVLTDEGINFLIKENCMEKSWKLLKDLTKQRILL